MSRKGIAVTCDSRRLHEVRVCLTRTCVSANAPTSIAAPAAATGW
jgi:hypothetical protein